MSKYISQYNIANTPQDGDYLLIQRGSTYYKLLKQDLYSDLSSTISSGLSFNLDDISNVDLTGAVTGSLLKYNGTNWVDTAVADYFTNGGEVGGANRTLGNTDAFALGFETNNTERVRITPTGEVGIGETTNSIIDDAMLYIKSSAKPGVISTYSTGTVGNVYEAYKAYHGSTLAFSLNGYKPATGNTAIGITVTNNTNELDVFRIDRFYDEDASAYVNDAVSGMLSIGGGNGGSNQKAGFRIYDSFGAWSDDSVIPLFLVDTLIGGGYNCFEVRANGWILMGNIPTSSAGLPSGAVWSNSNVLTIVP